MDKIKKCIICGSEVIRKSITCENGYQLSWPLDAYVCKNCAEIAGIKGYWDASKYTAKSFKKKYEEVLASMTLEQRLSGYIVSNPGITTKPGEVCFIEAAANAVNVKNGVLGNLRTSSHFGKGKRGTYSGSGLSLSTSIRGTITEKCPGKFYITNKRMIMIAARYGFEIPLDKITTIDIHSDGLIIYSNGKAYIIETPMAGRIKEFISLSNEYELSKQSSDIVASENDRSSQRIDETSEKDKIALLREYKSLLDDGIITQEEFENKKAEILR